LVPRQRKVGENSSLKVVEKYAVNFGNVDEFNVILLIKLNIQERKQGVTHAGDKI
jgi:hypothetical protein